MGPQRWIAGVALVLTLSATLQADTLILRDGTRVQGELIAVRNGVIEFEERSRFGAGRLLRLDRDEIVRIEFETIRSSGTTLTADTRPPGMRERPVIVSANTAWVDTGVDVRSGQTVYFEATGRARWGRDRQDGPAGERNSPPNPGRPMPNRNAAALIGKIGSESNDLFFIGDETGAVRVRGTGRLFLGINDDVLTDNSGNFRVVVYY